MDKFIGALKLYGMQASCAPTDQASVAGNNCLTVLVASGLCLPKARRYVNTTMLGPLLTTSVDFAAMLPLSSFAYRATQPKIWMQPWAEQAGLVQQIAHQSCPSQSHPRHQPTQGTHQSCQCMPTLPFSRRATGSMSPLTWYPNGYEKVHGTRASVQCRHSCLLGTLNTSCMGMNAVQYQKAPSKDFLFIQRLVPLQLHL